MKRLAILLVVVLITICQTTYAQQTSGWYIETTKFQNYLSKDPKDPDKRITEYRYDNLHRTILIFGNTSDSVVIATLFDYDANGNRIESTTVVFKKDKKIPYRYILDGQFDEKKFRTVVQKIMDRLDSK